MHDGVIVHNKPVETDSALAESLLDRAKAGEMAVLFSEYARQLCGTAGMEQLMPARVRRLASGCPDHRAARRRNCRCRPAKNFGEFAKQIGDRRVLALVFGTERRQLP